MSDYQKPLARGGHRNIARASDGKFYRPSLGGVACPNQECRAFNFPEYVNEGTEAFLFLRKQYPTHCKHCGEKL